MTRLDAIRAEISNGVLKQRLTGIAHEKETLANVTWLVEMVDILRASIESTSVLLSELGHSEEHLNRPEETVCLDCFFVKNALARLEEPK